MLFQVYTENGVKKIKYLTADTGTGAPVGSIIVVCSNILPSGYLGLGVQYDITNYPALYQVLGTDTTPTASALGLPTLTSGQYAIKATSGLSENAQENVLNTINDNLSYSTTEHATGKKWIDGKPIYRKVVDCGTLPNNTSKTVNHNISNFGELVSMNAHAKQIINGVTFYLPIPYGSAVDPTIIYISEVGIVLSNVQNQTSWTDTRVTLEYTKTTD